LRIGISGYGQMGVLIRQKALAWGFAVSEVIDPHGSAAEITAREISSISTRPDVIIDFTHPKAVIANIEQCGELKIPVVVGTTGWYDQMGQVADIVKKAGIGLVWAGNFSLGVNLFLRLVETAGLLMDRFPQYDAAVHECHHRYKADSPSGTAQMIGDIMIRTLGRKSETVSDSPESKIGEHQLHLSSTRIGSVPGMHRLIFDSEFDTLILEHRARSREGFAEGALAAAQWIFGREGFYNINEMMESVIGGVEDREHL